MRQKLITLDPTSWDLAAKKPNFSEWVRNQLRSERNKQEIIVRPRLADITTQRILWELNKRSDKDFSIKEEEE